MTTPWGGPTQHFFSLTPDVIDQVLRSHGLRPTGRILALNSLENRVNDVEVASIPDLPEGPYAPDSVVVKFYRPGRWSFETIKEEHAFLNELLSYEIPVIPALEKNGQTLFQHAETGLIYTVFPKIRGRLKDELNAEEAVQIGRLIARLHNIGNLNPFKHRLKLDPTVWLMGNLKVIETLDFIDPDLKKNYATLVTQLHQWIDPVIKALPVQRVHGDFHRGNVLWTRDGAFITDLDDAVMGPVQQDLWLLFSGRDEWSDERRAQFLEGYSEMTRNPIHLTRLVIECLRTMRLVHFNGWIGNRWSDPIFQNMFQNFTTRNYWEQQVLDLKEQMGHLQDSF